MTPSPQAPLPCAKQGYAAITSIIIIIAVTVLVGTTTSLLGIGNAQMSLGESRGEATIQLVESCIEDALLYYNNTTTIPTSRTTPQGNCSITLNSSDASSATFTTSATLNGSTHSIQVTATRVSNVAVVNWVQID